MSLAHHGVLFLDEMPEFPRAVLEVLRQPLEDGSVNIARASMTLTFPARFILIGSMNPCPCGYSTDPTKNCTCTPQAIQRYVGRLSGPLMDRIDLHVDVPAVPVAELARRDAVAFAEARAAAAAAKGEGGATAIAAPPASSGPESSAAVRERVEAARDLQRRRYARLSGVHCNAHLAGRELKRHCALAPEPLAVLQASLERLGLSARAYDRVLKVSRTIADLSSSEDILAEHVAEAISYRTLDRSA